MSDCQFQRYGYFCRTDHVPSQTKRDNLRQDFQDTSYRIVLGRSFYLTENFKIKPTLGKAGDTHLFKQTENTITGYPVNFTAFNTTFMVAWDQTNEFIHDAGVYADFGTFSQYGVEYQLTYRP